jgi:hypothetical protein
MSRGSEAERAAYYDGHRAEVEAWPEVPTPPDAKAPKQRSVVVSVRFTREEAAAIERAAEAQGLTLSSYLRAIARQAAGTEPPLDTAHIADRLQAIADELRPGSRSATGRRRAGTPNAGGGREPQSGRA